jgi:class 3 adenylate cyclase/ketosteroid isomerase-like protein
MAVSCAACGHANRGDARFCAGCGMSLSASCAACGAALKSDAQFCDECGAAVAAREPPGTRKVVSVVFADLAGSTGLQESLDPESVRRVMERFYKTMRSVVEVHGGQVAKFIGDAVVAVFGARSVDEHDALRAVRAAAAMGAELTRLNDDLERSWGVRLTMRTGVNTGELVIGAEEEIFVGDAMNTAARLEQAAAAGEVLVGEATWRLVHHAVELESVGELELKGKAQAVPAWRLLSAVAGVEGDRAPSSARLIGRAAELQRLHAALDEAIAARACRLVSVIGSPGVGKTRLAGEFAHTLGDAARAVEGRCEPSGEGITFLPVAEILREVAGVGEADTPEALRVKLTALVLDDPERERLVERAAGVLGVAEAASPEETFWALRRVVESLAQERPLVLLLDDLHWGQSLLLDLVEHLVEWVRDAPVLILALGRPELREARDTLTAAGGLAVDVIELDPLDEAESRMLVGELLGRVELPAALSERILETAEGNPLFLGEMLRMLIDEGALRHERERWVAAGDLADVEVPPTIQALLAARLARLRSEEREVVERASVIGKQFFRGAVAELVAPGVRAEIDGHLEALRRKDMVEPEGTYWIDEPVYRFHHVLIRDAAYRSLLKEARAELHERFANWLESKAGEPAGEHEEVIAFHLEQAHSYHRELGPLDERGRKLGARAAARLHSAGRRALAREDLAAAVNLLGRALAREAGPEEEILWDLAEAALSAGDTADAAPVAERLAASAGGGEPRLRARAATLAGQLANLTGAGHVAATVESVLAAATELEVLGDLVGEAKARHVLAESYARLGQVGAVEEALDRALAAARAADDRRRITAVLAGAPRAALWGPSPVVRASGRCLDVVRILRMTPGNRHVEAMALRCQAVLEAMRGRPDAAREILGTGRVTLQELGLTLELHELSMHDGMVELLADDPLAAEGHLRAAREGFEALGVASGAAQAAALLARALLEQTGRDEEAIAQTLFAEEHGGEDLKTTITWSSARAEALARNGENEQALSFAHHAVSLAGPTDVLADKAEASMALARVLRAAGRDAQAREAAEAARALYAAKGHVVGVERAARLAGEQAISVQAEPALGAARTVPRFAGRSEGLAPPDSSGAEQAHAEAVRRYNSHDLERLLECYDERLSFVDHREPSWEPWHGLAGAERFYSSIFEISPDARQEVDEILACDDRVIALRTTIRGSPTEGVGDLEYPFGYVAVFESGRMVSQDAYDYEDRRAIVARYAEVGGGQGLLGDRAPERFYAEFARRYAARDIYRLADLYAEDWAFLDHRNIGWDELHGRQAAVDIVRSAFAVTTDLHVDVDEVLACDDRVIAMRLTYLGSSRDGGGRVALAVSLVSVIESGRCLSAEQYDHDDRTALLARYAELGGRAQSALTP